jgi:hypothetical protein
MRKPKEKYRLSTGEVCPGVTTICGQLGWNKNALVMWANRLGMKGIDANKFKDDKAEIGSLAHSMVLAEISGTEVDTSDYTQKQIDLAKNCLKSYHEWSKGRKIEPIVVEKMIVSEEMKFGGTPDFYGKIDGVTTLNDYKTGSGIYDEYVIQVAAYAHLLKESGNNHIENVMILNIPRTDDESFQVRVITESQLKAGFEIFKHLLGVYWLKNAIKKEEPYEAA